MNRPPPAPSALPMIRIALLTGVLAFGAVTWWMQRQSGWTPPNPNAAAALRPIGLALWGLAIAGVVVMWVVMGRARDEVRRRSLTPAAWAMGEVPALFGAVLWFLTGDAMSFLMGLAWMLGVFVLFPATPRRR